MINTVDSKVRAFISLKFKSSLCHGLDVRHPTRAHMRDNARRFREGMIGLGEP